MKKRNYLIFTNSMNVQKNSENMHFSRERVKESSIVSEDTFLNENIDDWIGSMEYFCLFSFSSLPIFFFFFFFFSRNNSLILSFFDLSTFSSLLLFLSLLYIFLIVKKIIEKELAGREKIEARSRYLFTAGWYDAWKQLIVRGSFKIMESFDR